MQKIQTAPGRLELVRGFVNTLDVESGEDQLGTGASALTWFAENGFEDTGPLEDEDLSELRVLREAIRPALLANGGDGEADPAWRRLARAIDGTAVDIRMGAPGSAELAAPQRRGPASLKTNLAIAIYEALADGRWRRLKACRKHSCQWAFYDRSKNGSGAWCNMAVCGNRVKAARRRARERSD